MNIRRLVLGAFALLLMGAIVASAGYADLYISGHPFNAANGGRFTGTISGNGIYSFYQTAKFVGGFWCVDGDYTVTVPGSYRAHVTGIGTEWALAATEHGVGARKNGASFKHSILIGVNEATAQQRYKIAAALIGGYVSVSGYSGYSDGIKKPTDGTVKNADNRDRAIQQAIWYALDEVGQYTDYGHVDLGADYEESATWLEAARAFVAGNESDARFNRWALISAYGASSTTLHQAFLGEVPEPAFLGLLAVGLTAVYFRRKRRNA